MEARCATSYANAFLAWWECTHVYQQPSFWDYVIEWHSFIDDILFFWSGTLEQCLEFDDSLNTSHLIFLLLQ